MKELVDDRRTRERQSFMAQIFSLRVTSKWIFYAFSNTDGISSCHRTNIYIIFRLICKFTPLSSSNHQNLTLNHNCPFDTLKMVSPRECESSSDISQRVIMNNIVVASPPPHPDFRVGDVDPSFIHPIDAILPSSSYTINDGDEITLAVRREPTEEEYDGGSVIEFPMLDGAIGKSREEFWLRKVEDRRAHVYDNIDLRTVLVIRALTPRPFFLSGDSSHKPEHYQYVYEVVGGTLISSVEGRIGCAGRRGWGASRKRVEGEGDFKLKVDESNEDGVVKVRATWARGFSTVHHTEWVEFKVEGREEKEL